MKGCFGLIIAIVICVAGCDRKARQDATSAIPGKRHAVATDPAPVEWYPSTSVVKMDDVSIRVKFARVGAVEIRGFGDSRHSAESQLMIGLEVENLSDSKKIDYRSMGENVFVGPASARMADDIGNKYRRIDFGPLRAVGQASRDSIYPGKSTSDMVVFEPPVDKAAYVHLELPAENFGGRGMIRFEIPTSEITR